MAIVRSLAVGKARKSAGNLTYQTVKGRTIAREKPAFVANPNTPAQQAQRAKMSTMVEAWRAWFATLASFFTVIKGYGSAYNEFVSRNIHLQRVIFFDPDTDKLHPGTGITVATGKYGSNALNATLGANSITVGVNDFQLRNDMLVGDRMMAYIFSTGMPLPEVLEHVLNATDIDTLSTGGTISIPHTATGDVIVYAAWFYSSARRIGSTAIVSD